MWKILALVGVAAALTGCGSSLDCEISGDNIQGHVIFGEGVPRTSSRRVVVQVSTDTFAANATTAFETVNTQGLVAIPYTYCAPTATNLTFRAFEDTNSNGSWDAGEPAGRYDGTGTDNSAHTVKNLPKPDSNAVPPVDWKIESDINVTLDSTVAQ